MRFLAAVFLLALATAVSAADGRKYAVLSLIGDQLLVAQRGVSIRSAGDPNTREFVPLKGPAFDREAVFAVEDAIKRQDKGAAVVLLGANDPALFEAQRRLLDQEGTTQAFLPAIKDAMANAEATHLVLVSKHRGPARLKMADGHVGGGMLEGLGFYLDHHVRMRNVQTGEQSQGYIAPFAYVRISLVDLASGTITREEVVMASAPMSSQKADATWQMLSAEEKARILRNLIRREVARVIPLLLV